MIHTSSVLIPFVKQYLVRMKVHNMIKDINGGKPLKKKEKKKDILFILALMRQHMLMPHTHQAPKMLVDVSRTTQTGNDTLINSSLLANKDDR